MRLCKLLIFFLSFILSAPALYAQFIVRGTVTDAKTGEALPGVNVYLANTTIGTSTDEEGFYQISEIPSGVNVLVFSIVGYKTRTFQLNVKNTSSSKQRSVTLQPHTFELTEVEVKGSNKEWKRNFERFRKAFIGQTKFAGQTTIENPWIIDFRDDEKNNELIATAREPLAVINKALGYKLHVELVEFRWLKSKDTGIYKIYPRFDPLKASSKKQMQRWQRNRIKTYLGSFQHFLKSLYTGSVDQNHFSVVQQRNINPVRIGEVRFELMQRGGLANALQNTIKGYRIDHPVQVRYQNTQRIETKNGRRKIRVKKKAAIEPNTENGLFLIHETGKLVDPASLILYWDWGRTRVADTLPDNYEVGD